MSMALKLDFYKEIRYKKIHLTIEELIREEREKMLEKIELSRFCSNLSAMQKSGIPLVFLPLTLPCILILGTSTHEYFIS